MKEQSVVNYNRIATAIEYIRTHYQKQPTLDDIAQVVHLSPYHLQRLFTEWAGVSPKKFLQYITIEHAKNILTGVQPSLFAATHQVGLSSTSRLHDLFVNIEGMTPGEYKNGGEHLVIQYDFVTTPFGLLLVGKTDKGVCYTGFVDKAKCIEDMTRRFPNAMYENRAGIGQDVADVFKKNFSSNQPIKLHIKGTDFQLKVWEALLKIPMGNLATYGSIAESIDSPNASRAVGTAIGSNPVGFIIPCHRVIRASGVIGNYMWGQDRKTAMIGWEAAKSYQ